MKRWLARLSFSFFIVGGLLGWTVYRARTGTGPPLSDARMILYTAAAAVCFVLGFLGVRERHRGGNKDEGGRMKDE